MAIQLVDSVNSHTRCAKGGCYRDGRNNDGIVLLDVSIEGEGQLAICRHCAKQVAKVIGYVDPGFSQHLYEQLCEAKETLIAQREKIQSMNELIGKQNGYIEAHVKS